MTLTMEYATMPFSCEIRCIAHRYNVNSGTPTEMGVSAIGVDADDPVLDKWKTPKVANELRLMFEMTDGEHITGLVVAEDCLTAMIASDRELERVRLGCQANRDTAKQ